ncbi:MAG: hypothetical protein ACRELY_31730 [Polyangiaceae bacterium]
MNDTSAGARDRYHVLLRSRKPSERLEQASALSRSVRDLALAGLRARHPKADDAELRARLIVRIYGHAVAKKLCGEIPADAV